MRPPVSTVSSAAASRTVIAIGPAVSCECEIGTMPCCGTSPTPGLIPTTPFTAAGHTIEPLVSVPTASGTIPAATAAPDPLAEPPADRFSAYGLRVSPPYPDQPDEDRDERKFAHS